MTLSPDVSSRLLAAKAKLEKLRNDGVFDSDIDGVYWSLEQALLGNTYALGVLQYADEVLARYGQVERKPVAVSAAKTISKAEHDALLDKPATQSIDREAYERMMREAQDA